MAEVTRDVRKRFGGERGAELLELAITLPILLVVFAAMIDFAVLFQRYQVVTNAAREGARVGILPDYAVADVQARVNTYLTQSGLTDAAPAPGVTYTSVGVPGGATMSVVRVTVQYPHQFIFLGPAIGLVGGGAMANVMLAAGATMRQEMAAVAP